MANKNLHLLLPSTNIILLLFGCTILATGQAPANSVFIPMVTKDLSGWLGPNGGFIVSIATIHNDTQVVYAGS